MGQNFLTLKDPIVLTVITGATVIGAWKHGHEKGKSQRIEGTDKVNCVEAYRVLITLGSSHLDNSTCDSHKSISTFFFAFFLFPSVRLDLSELRVS